MKCEVDGEMGAQVFKCATAPPSGNTQMAHSALVCEGYGDGFDDVIIQGDLDELRFVAFYTR